jgi:glyceraldehyde-3-phosphate dehydrogenase/erythrose-4-phosphate dehydrogenase
VTLEQSSVCVVDATGKIVREKKVANEFDDAVWRRVLMTAPGVGAVVAITSKSAVDDPGRFAP